MGAHIGFHAAKQLGEFNRLVRKKYHQ